MKDFDVKALGGVNLPEGVKITKQLTREVDNQKASIFIGKDSEGNKVRYTIINGEAKELVATDTTGKNKYTTKEEFEAELMNKYGMSSKEFARKGIIAEYKHGELTFTNIKSGEKIPDAVLAQQEVKHQQDVANEKIKKAQIKMPEFELGVIELPRIDKNELAKLNITTSTDEVKKQGATEKSKKPKGMTGQRAVGPEVTVVGNKARVGRLNRAYPPSLSANDKRMAHISGDSYMLVPPKPQGNGKNEPAYGYDMYSKVKVGNKEIFLRSNLSPADRQKAIDKELANQKAEADKAKAKADAQAKKQVIIDKGRQAGRLVGITPDRVLDQISSDVKSLNAGTVKDYLSGYKRATGGRDRNNFFQQLWRTGHDGKNEAQWKREKLDIMNKILSEFAKTSGAKNATFEKTVYKGGKKETVTLTLESVMKEIQDAKANMQKGIPADETVRDVARIMSRFGYGNADA